MDKTLEEAEAATLGNKLGDVKAEAVVEKV